MRAPYPALSLFLVLGVAACGGGAGPAPATPTAFTAMNQEQRLHHMKAVIQPTIGKIFRAHDEKKFADFGCATCHGSKNEDPHKALPRLTLSGDGLKRLSDEKPAMMKFMSEQVTPAMATAMGDKPYDAATRQGFGCGGCHAVQ